MGLKHMRECFYYQELISEMLNNNEIDCMCDLINCSDLNNSANLFYLFDMDFKEELVNCYKKGNFKIIYELYLSYNNDEQFFDSLLRSDNFLIFKFIVDSLDTKEPDYDYTNLLEQTKDFPKYREYIEYYDYFFAKL